jgi:ribosomal protein L11 methyltransferase
VARTVACLDLRFPPPAVAPDLPERVTVALHNFPTAAIHESGEDDAPTWRVFFSDPSAIDDAVSVLGREFRAAGLIVSRAAVDDEDWAARSQAHLTRVEVGRITVAPPWDAAAPVEGLRVVVLPSTGFGTGHHQTTRLCLRLLQEIPLAGRRVLDLGTGSGVLAIAAWRLGAASVEAVDYDVDAITNARENFELNDAVDAIALRQADLAVDSLAPADVVVGNLTGALLVAQAANITALVGAGGTLVVSGILAEEIDDVRTALSKTLTVVDERAENEWCAIRLERR